MDRAEAIKILEKMDIYCNAVETARDMAIDALREQEQSNEPLTLEELMEMDAPVWCVCKPIEGGNGYWCLCRKGHITTPAGSYYYVSEIPHWVFLRNKPEEGADHA